MVKIWKMNCNLQTLYKENKIDDENKNNIENYH